MEFFALPMGSRMVKFEARFNETAGGHPPEITKCQMCRKAAGEKHAGRAHTL